VQVLFSEMIVRVERALLSLSLALAVCGEAPSVVRAPRGRTPVLDGRVSPGEWADAFAIVGISGWNPQFAPVSPPAPGAAPDLDVAFFVKHDHEALYIAARVTDDVLYAAGSWTPAGNPGANALNQSGWPWFGDESEVLYSAVPPAAAPNASVAGTPSAWQMVFNRAKSRLGGLGVGGLLEGEPRSSPSAWATYGRWIADGAQQAATTTTPGGGAAGANLYEFEWRVAFDPCLQLTTGEYYNADMKTVAVGLNIALGDVDTPGEGDKTYGLRHEMWLSGKTCAATNCHTLMSEFATLLLEPGPL